MKTVFIICAVTLFLLSCSKNNSQTSDTVPPVIQILSPVNNQVYTAGQIIQTTANATDNIKVTELHIHITNNANGNLLRDIHAYPDNKNGTIEDSFTAQVGMSYNIKVIAYDPEHNLATDDVNVTVN